MHNLAVTLGCTLPYREFTEVIWKAVKGENAIVPAPKTCSICKAG